jgi:hypothetical protein
MLGSAGLPFQQQRVPFNSPKAFPGVYHRKPCIAARSGTADTISSTQKLQPLVRPLQEADKQAWWDLFQDYITWYKASVPDDVIELTWQRLLAGGEGNHQGLVAEDSSSGQVCTRQQGGSCAALVSQHMYPECSLDFVARFRPTGSSGAAVYDRRRLARCALVTRTPGLGNVTMLRCRILCAAKADIVVQARKRQDTRYIQMLISMGCFCYRLCCCCCCCRLAQQLLGLAHILLHRSTWSATHYCYLEDLYVHHEVRRA